MKSSLHIRLFPLATLAILSLTGCSFMGSAVNKIPMPSMPSVPKVGEMLGFWPSEDRASDDDPTMPFNSRGTLGYGHTVRVEIFEGTRHTDQLYRTVAMINERGILDLGKFGSAKVGGSKLPDARRAIESAFQLSGATAKAITVHIISVENVGLIGVTGDVQEDEYVPVFSGMRVSNAVTVAGGRKLGSTANSVYLIRAGERRFFRNIAQADAEWTPKAGDIIRLSPDI